MNPPRLQAASPAAGDIATTAPGYPSRRLPRHTHIAPASAGDSSSPRSIPPPAPPASSPWTAPQTAADLAASAAADAPAPGLPSHRLDRHFGVLCPYSENIIANKSLQ